MTDNALDYGRALSLYQDKTYIKNENGIIYDLDGNAITENAFSYSFNSGFHNGYCFVSNSNGGGCNLIDANGNVVYTKAKEENGGFKLYPVDQKGLFTIAYYLNNDVVKSEIVDLNGTVIYSSDNDYEIEALGNGIFRQHNKKGYALYRVTAE